MKFKSKGELENYIKLNTIPSSLELRKSDVGGLGLFTLVDIPLGTQFQAIDLGKGYNSVPGLCRYTWWGDGTVYGGVGYYCNGSCDQFIKCINKGINKLGPYKLLKYNIQLIGDKFTVLNDIPKGSELILDYSNNYFYANDEFTELIVDDEYHLVNISSLLNFSERINLIFD